MKKELFKLSEMTGDYKDWYYYHCIILNNDGDKKCHLALFINKTEHRDSFLRITFLNNCYEELGLGYIDYFKDITGDYIEYPLDNVDYKHLTVSIERYVNKTKIIAERCKEIFGKIARSR